MTNNITMLCYEIATRVEIDNPQALIPFLSHKVDFETLQDAPHLLYIHRRLIFKAGTDDVEKIRSKERRYVERIINEQKLEANIISIEVMHEHSFTLPQKYVEDYNPVCFSAYFDKEDEMFKE